MSEYPLENALHLIEVEAAKREKNAKHIRNMVRFGETHSDALSSAGEDERVAGYLRDWVSKLNAQAETIARLEAELEISTKREAELVEKLEEYTEWKQQDKKLIKHFKKGRDQLLTENAELNALLQDSVAYETMLLDGSDDTSAPDYAGVEANDYKNASMWTAESHDDYRHVVAPNKRVPPITICGLPVWTENWENYNSFSKCPDCYEALEQATLHLAADDDTCEVDVDGLFDRYHAIVVNKNVMVWDALHNKEVKNYVEISPDDALWLARELNRTTCELGALKPTQVTLPDGAMLIQDVEADSGQGAS